MRELTYTKRFTVALAKKGEANCFLHFAETDRESEAKRLADDKSLAEGRECVVFDNQSFPSSAYRVGKTVGSESTRPALPPVKKGGKKGFLIPEALAK